MKLNLILVLITLALIGMAACQTCTKSGSYNIDEGPTANKCKNECDCFGTRSCSTSGFCQECQKGPSYNIDEGKNALGPNRCNIDCQCTGTRSCSSAGYCN